MRPLNLQEFAEDMRRKGDIRDADMADEILALLDIEAEVAEPYSDLCADLENCAPKGLAEQPAKALEWVIDRSNLLLEIEGHLKEAKRDGDPDDAVKELLGTMADAEAILEAAGWPGMDFLEALQGLADRAARAPEETEIMTYDL
jgi:hypothetical protein